ncbi:MAG: hypothetical protein QOE36_863 [Gaiellaceae bacterium]|jgi:UDP-N-acetylmuramyl pentapeptide synthase|nr:hypothetical protein [Gaiellaceae bacterium]
MLAGRAADADVRLVDARLAWPNGLDVSLVVHGRPVAGRVGLHAAHLGRLVALAAAAAETCGVPAELVVEAAASFEPEDGRMRRVRGPNGSFLLDRS